ncbi:hypothetical protein GGR58DRAFT_232648 [Xylaria digitata]|nr:hypothetical protein GGR58DRAFT_232648 [Xylaria digitata]
MAYVNLDHAVFWTPPLAAGLRPARRNLQKPSVQHSAASLESQSKPWPESRVQDAQSLGDFTSEPIFISDNESSDDEDRGDKDDTQSDISSNTSDPCKSFYLWPRARRVRSLTLSAGSASTAFEEGVNGEPSPTGMTEPTQQRASSKEPLSHTLETTAALIPVSGQPPHPVELSSPFPAPLQTDQSTTYRTGDPVYRGSHASESGDTISDIDQEALEAATASDPCGLHSNEPQSSSHRPRRCDEDACQESRPCDWCTRFPRLSAMFKRSRKNRANCSDTSREAESLEAVVDSVCLSQGPLYAASEDERETEHGPDGGQSPEHRSHGSDDTNDPEPLYSRDLDDMEDLNEEAADVQSLAHEHQLDKAGMDESSGLRCSSQLSLQSDEGLCRESLESTLLLSGNKSNDFGGQHPNKIAAIRQPQRSSQRNDKAEPAVAEREQNQDEKGRQPPVRKCREVVIAKHTRLSGADTRQLRPRVPKHASFGDNNQEREENGNVRSRACKRHRAVVRSFQGTSAASLDEQEDDQQGPEAGLDHDDVDSNDEYRPASKRRKTNLAHNNTTQTQRQQKRGRRSVQQQTIQALAGGRNPSPSQGLPSLPSSQTSYDKAYAALAKFEEWPLENVLLKRVMVSGVATFQLQFTWDLCQKHGDGGEDCSTENQRPTSRSKRGALAKQGRAGKGTSAPGEDEFLIELKEELGLPWKEIHKRFTASFPGRSLGALQVRYCTKLKGRGSSKTSSRRGRSSQAGG